MSNARVAIFRANERWRWDTPSGTYALVLVLHAANDVDRRPAPKSPRWRRTT